MTSPRIVVAGGETLVGARARVLEELPGSLLLQLLQDRGSWRRGDKVNVKPDAVRPWVPALEEEDL